MTHKFDPRGQQHLMPHCAQWGFSFFLLAFAFDDVKMGYTPRGIKDVGGEHEI